MTPHQIDKVLKAAQHSGLTPEKLGAELTQSPYNLTPPEATQIMDRYRRMPAPRIPIVRTSPPPAEAAPRSGGILNRSAVKKYALLVSEKKRAGKFTRVGSDFFDAVEASLESAIRALPESPADAPETNDTFITGKAVKRAAERLNKTVKCIIFKRVITQPTMGCTLK